MSLKPVRGIVLIAPVDLVALSRSQLSYAFSGVTVRREPFGLNLTKPRANGRHGVLNVFDVDPAAPIEATTTTKKGQ